MPPAKKKAEGGQKYIRNVRYVPVSIRLDTGRRIELKPRGMRGDCVPIKTEETEDEKFLLNEGILFEVITPSEAKNVIAKQTTNQQAVHPALNSMRSEYGEEYTRGVVVEENFTDQGQRVAAVNERGEIQRFVAPGTQAPNVPEVPADVPPEERADWLARQNVEGPEAGLGGLKVTKDNVQKN